MDPEPGTVVDYPPFNAPVFITPPGLAPEQKHELRVQAAVYGVAVTKIRWEKP